MSDGKIMTKTCPLMSRPAPILYSGGTSPDISRNIRIQFELMKVRCLEDDCQFWEEACDQNDCQGCDYEDDYEGTDDCPGKKGYCKYVDSMEG
jgi:hypothetical protein